MAEEFAETLKRYRITKVHGDRYGGEWPREQFRKNGVNYENADRTKSELFIDMLPLINSRGVDLLDNDRLMHQLISLERRTTRSGKDSIDHPPGAHDDLANAAAGALCQAFVARSNSELPFGGTRLPQVLVGYSAVKSKRLGRSRCRRAHRFQCAIQVEPTFPREARHDEPRSAAPWCHRLPKGVYS